MKACLIKYKEEDRNRKIMPPYLGKNAIRQMENYIHMKLELLATKKRKTDIKFEAYNLKIISRILDMSSL